MATRTILMDNDKALRAKSREVEVFNDKLCELLDDMAQTMREANGCGLAANQIGILRRIFIADDGNGVREFINPKILSAEGEQVSTEGCLSVAERRGEVKRPAKVVIKYYNRKAEPQELTAVGLLAIIISHENDHLDGKLFTDYLVKEAE